VTTGRSEEAGRHEDDGPHRQERDVHAEGAEREHEEPGQEGAGDRADDDDGDDADDDGHHRPIIFPSQRRPRPARMTKIASSTTKPTTAPVTGRLPRGVAAAGVGGVDGTVEVPVEGGGWQEYVGQVMAVETSCRGSVFPFGVR
jgi:hypothetical protein